MKVENNCFSTCTFISFFCAKTFINIIGTYLKKLNPCYDPFDCKKKKCVLADLKF